MRALSSVKTCIDSDARFPEIRLDDLETATREKPECSWSQTYLTRLRTYQPSQRVRAPLHRDAPLTSPDVTPASRRLREAAAESHHPESGSPSLLARSAPCAVCLERALPHGIRRVGKGPRCFPKTFPWRKNFQFRQNFSTNTEGRIDLCTPSFAFLPCLRPETRANPAPQGGRPKGRTAESLGGQPCPNSGARRSRWLASSWPTAATNTVDRSL